MYLRAIAMYTDRTRDGADVEADANMLFMNTATSDPTTAVRNNPDNQAPKFDRGCEHIPGRGGEHQGACWRCRR